MEQNSYRLNERTEIVPFIPADASRVLDVGCASGGFGAALRRARPDVRELEGVEPLQSEAVVARQGAYDVIHDGCFPEALSAATREFDGIVMNDVLEHMIDPWGAIDSARDFLKPEGWIVASIPSIQYLPIWWGVFRGTWEYADEGTLDRTHLRFFTRSSMMDLFKGAGFDVVLATGINSLFGHPRYRRAKFLNRVIGDRQFVQFVIVARSQG